MLINYTDSIIKEAELLFNTKLKLVSVIKKTNANLAWSSEIYKVQELDTGKTCIYKIRRVFPLELVEIEQVLNVLIASSIPHMCEIIKFRLNNHRIHILLEEIPGVSLDHYHNEGWENNPAFIMQLDTYPISKKINFSYQLMESLYRLHKTNLLFQDLKIEQIIIRDSQSIFLIDVDTIVLRDGLCANNPTWRSHLYAPPLQWCCEQNDIFQAGCVMFELFTGTHLNSGCRDCMPITPISNLIRKMTDQSYQDTNISALDVLSALAFISKNLNSRSNHYS